MRWLWQIYEPEVRGTWSGGSNISGDEIALCNIRNDDFERSYAIRWLTSLIGHVEELEQIQLSERYTALLECQDSTVETLIANAASLLAACAGTASSGQVTRSYKFSVASSSFSNASLALTSSGYSDGAMSISVSLTDVPLENGDYSSVGAQTWGSAVVLSRLILEEPGPAAFGLPLGSIPPESSVELELKQDRICECDTTSDNSRAQKFRVLELGAGTGLVGPFSSTSSST